MPPDTETPTDTAAIDEAAVSAMHAFYSRMLDENGQYDDADLVRHVARAGVAAELRHQARLIDEQVEVMYEAGDSEDGMAAYEAIAAALRVRADQLDSAGG